MSTGAAFFIVYVVILIIFIFWIMYFSYNESQERLFHMKATEEHLRSISVSLRHMCKEEN